MNPQVLLVAAVAAVGVLHTTVPDHWLPIALMARQEGWARRDTARAAFGAGIGHSLSTLAIGAAVWLMGAAFATRFGQTVSGVASLALIRSGYGSRPHRFGNFGVTPPAAGTTTTRDTNMPTVMAIRTRPRLLGTAITITMVTVGSTRTITGIHRRRGTRRKARLPWPGPPMNTSTVRPPGGPCP